MRISRGVIMTVAQSSNNAVTPLKGPPSGKGGGGETSCDQEIGWNISRVTTMEQAGCVVSATSGLADYSSISTDTLKVCVIDTGLPETHEDLNIAGRFGTISGSTAVEDGHGHGTHVAGIIGARANNLGVVPGVPITSIKVLKDDGSGSDFDVIAGIDKALDVGCDIVNMSLGGIRHSRWIRQFITHRLEVPNALSIAMGHLVV